MSFLFSAILILFVQIVGAEAEYTVRPGDSLVSVGARFGVDVRVLAKENNLENTSWLMAGQSLRINNRHIVPESEGSVLVINVPQRMLFYYRDGKVFRHYPIAAGKPGWHTPLGVFTVISMEREPVWDVPLSIQEEMRRQGGPVVTRVPASPENPLGRYWIGLSLPGVGIHGTNAPNTIYKSQTHGCIRLHPEDIEDLFSLIEVGVTGRVIYQRVLMTKAADSVFLEVHPDTYRKGGITLGRMNEIARAAGYFDNVDWELAKQVIRMHDGIARDVTRHPMRRQQ